MATLLENYKDKLSIANGLYAKSHNGQQMSESKQIVVAKCVDNISR